MRDATPAERNDRACSVERSLNRLVKRGLLTMTNTHTLPPNPDGIPLKYLSHTQRFLFRHGKTYHVVGGVK
jgi:hypothetical protein